MIFRHLKNRGELLEGWLDAVAPQIKPEDEPPLEAIRAAYWHEHYTEHVPNNYPFDNAIDLEGWGHEIR